MRAKNPAFLQAKELLAGTGGAKPPCPYEPNEIRQEFYDNQSGVRAAAYPVMPLVALPAEDDGDGDEQ